MKDDLEFNLKFIELVQERPCLYDFNNSYYNNKFPQDAAWLEISEKVKETVEDCKGRWKNLRGCYTRHLKNNKRASSSSAKQVKPYYLADKLQFLNQFTKTKPRKRNYKMEEEPSTEIEIEAPDDTDDEDENGIETPPPAPWHTVKIEDCSHFLTPNETTPKNVSLSEVNGTTTELMQDPDLSFFVSLLPDVKDMNREQKRRFKMGVLKLADDILQN